MIRDDVGQSIACPILNMPPLFIGHVAFCPTHAFYFGCGVNAGHHNRSLYQAVRADNLLIHLLTLILPAFHYEVIIPFYFMQLAGVLIGGIKPILKTLL